jgi:hypothetical protein
MSKVMKIVFSQNYLNGPLFHVSINKAWGLYMDNLSRRSKSIRDQSKLKLVKFHNFQRGLKICLTKSIEKSSLWCSFCFWQTCRPDKFISIVLYEIFLTLSSLTSRLQNKVRNIDIGMISGWHLINILPWLDRY